MPASGLLVIVVYRLVISNQKRRHLQTLPQIWPSGPRLLIASVEANDIYQENHEIGCIRACSVRTLIVASRHRCERALSRARNSTSKFVATPH